MIENIDKNFMLNSGLSRKDIKVYNASEEPFSVYGLIPPSGKDDCYRRVPADVAESVSEGVTFLAKHTTGGRVRFKTDSDYIAIYAKLNNMSKMSHMPYTGSIGFDLYCEDNGEHRCLKTFVPPHDIDDSYESEFEIKNPEMREYTINFPLYSGVTELYIILGDKAKVEKCREYKYKVPVVFYGSSVTQGGCVSRPGNLFTNIISRRLDCDHINLGFSGSAKGEQEIADYIADLDMSVFVYGYDYNAHTPEYLEKTHYNMYKTIREKNPDLPIIFGSRVNFLTNADEFTPYLKIVTDTIERAKQEGDTKIYFVEGSRFWHELNAGDSMFVDNSHPNDLGFMCMANVIGEELKKLLK
ncbi:MAG: SGNH/GDSL hydrolase family protein [Clostridia bacterium]|nr:SGNH/GDSL hydrolase family protein [Clostridia bacterium]